MKRGVCPKSLPYSYTHSCTLISPVMLIDKVTDKVRDKVEHGPQSTVYGLQSTVYPHPLFPIPDSQFTFNLTPWPLQ